MTKENGNIVHYSIVQYCTVQYSTENIPIGNILTDGRTDGRTERRNPVLEVRIGHPDSSLICPNAVCCLSVTVVIVTIN